MNYDVHLVLLSMFAVLIVTSLAAGGYVPVESCTVSTDTLGPGLAPALVNGSKLLLDLLSCDDVLVANLTLSRSNITLNVSDAVFSSAVRRVTVFFRGVFLRNGASVIVDSRLIANATLEKMNAVNVSGAPGWFSMSFVDVSGENSGLIFLGTFPPVTLLLLQNVSFNTTNSSFGVYAPEYEASTGYIAKIVMLVNISLLRGSHLIVNKSRLVVQSSAGFASAYPFFATGILSLRDGSSLEIMDSTLNSTSKNGVFMKGLVMQIERASRFWVLRSTIAGTESGGQAFAMKSMDVLIAGGSSWRFQEVSFFGGAGWVFEGTISFPRGFVISSQSELIFDQCQLVSRASASLTISGTKFIEHGSRWIIRRSYLQSYSTALLISFSKTNIVNESRWAILDSTLFTTNAYTFVLTSADTIVTQHSRWDLVNVSMTSNAFGSQQYVFYLTYSPISVSNGSVWLVRACSVTQTSGAGLYAWYLDRSAVTVSNESAWVVSSTLLSLTASTQVPTSAAWQIEGITINVSDTSVWVVENVTVAALRIASGIRFQGSSVAVTRNSSWIMYNCDINTGDAQGLIGGPNSVGLYGQGIAISVTNQSVWAVARCRFRSSAYVPVLLAVGSSASSSRGTILEVAGGGWVLWRENWLSGFGVNGSACIGLTGLLVMQRGTDAVTSSSEISFLDNLCLCNATASPLGRPHVWLNLTSAGPITVTMRGSTNGTGFISFSAGSRNVVNTVTIDNTTTAVGAGFPTMTSTSPSRSSDGSRCDAPATCFLPFTNLSAVDTVPSSESVPRGCVTKSSGFFDVDCSSLCVEGSKGPLCTPNDFSLLLQPGYASYVEPRPPPTATAEATPSRPSASTTMAISTSLSLAGLTDTATRPAVSPTSTASSSRLSFEATRSPSESEAATQTTSATSSCTVARTTFASAVLLLFGSEASLPAGPPPGTADSAGWNGRLASEDDHWNVKEGTKSEDKVPVRAIAASKRMIILVSAREGLRIVRVFPNVSSSGFSPSGSLWRSSIAPRASTPSPPVSGARQVSSAVVSIEGLISSESISGMSLITTGNVLSLTLVWEAAGPCIPGESSNEELVLQWTLLPLAPPTQLVVATNMAFRASSATSSAVGNPVAAISSTVLVSLRALGDCLFSDLDPLDPSVSPLGPSVAKFGRESGQFYRGGALAALLVYFSVVSVAILGAVGLELRRRVRKEDEPLAAGGGWLSVGFTVLRFPSCAMIFVGVFGEGLATCAVALLRLAPPTASDEVAAVAEDRALGAISLGMCVCVVIAAGTMTTGSRFRCRLERQPLGEFWVRRQWWWGTFLRQAMWQQHWREQRHSDAKGYKKRYFALMDDLEKPWWTSVELGSALLQGAVLGIRENDASVCSRQQWVLAGVNVIMLALALVLRPCGAHLSNVFLILLKAGAALISVLSVSEQDRAGGLPSPTIDSVTAVFTAVASVQTALSLLLLIMGVLPKLVETFSVDSRRKTTPGGKTAPKRTAASRSVLNFSAVAAPMLERCREDEVSASRLPKLLFPGGPAFPSDISTTEFLAQRSSQPLRAREQAVMAETLSKLRCAASLAAVSTRQGVDVHSWYNEQQLIRLEILLQAVVATKMSRPINEE